MGPLSTIAGVSIVNAVTARAAELLAAACTPPDVYTSANAATLADASVLERARARIRAL